MKKNKFKNIVLMGIVSSFAISPIILSSCTNDNTQNTVSDDSGINIPTNDENINDNKGENVEPTPSPNPTPSIPSDDDIQETNVYKIAIEGSYSDFLTLSKKENISPNEKIEYKYNDNAITSGSKIEIYYIYNSIEYALNSTSGSFLMPEGDIVIYVNAYRKFTSFNSDVNANIELNINGNLYNQNNENYFLIGSKLYLSFNKKINQKITQITLVNANNPGSTSILDINNPTITVPNNDFYIEVLVETIQSIDISGIFKSAVKYFDIFSLFPDSLKLNKTINSSDSSQINFDNFVDVGNIQTIGFGKQMNQFLSIVKHIETLFKTTDIIYSITDDIVALYQTFINNNPDNYQEWTYNNTIKNIDIKLKATLSDQSFKFLAKTGSLEVELYSDASIGSSVYGGRIQLSDGNAFKYDVVGDTYKFAIKDLGVNRMQLEVKPSTNNTTIATIYNFWGIDNQDTTQTDLGATTHAVLEVDSQFTNVIGKKGDFFSLSKKNRNLEIYDNLTGKLVGSKVVESNAAKMFYTNWYPLSSINGINTIKHSLKTGDDSNTKYFYLNNNANVEFTPEKTLGGFGSRYADIENKNIYIYGLDASGNAIDASLTIPMFFIQEDYDNTNTDSGYVKTNNKNSEIGLNISNNASSEVYNYLNGETFVRMDGYYNLMTSEDSGQQVNNDNIKNYIGDKDPWFNTN